MKKFVYLLLIAVVLPVIAFSQNTDKLNNVRNPIGPNSQIGGELPIPFVATFGPESFENATFPPAGWTRLNPGGGTGWARITNGVNVPGWGTAVVGSTPPGGGTAIAYATYSNGGPTSNDMWLITPQIMNINLSDSLIFYVKKWPGIQYADNLDVKISTTNNTTPGAFSLTVALLVYPGSNDTTWTRKAYRLSSVAGLTQGANIYVGFREHVLDNFNDGDVIGIDLVRVVEDLTAINQVGNEIPASFDLSQNYPNPFNPSTKINFALPTSGKVKLAVYDMLGNEVSVLFDGNKDAGFYTASFDASKLATGVYFYKLTTENNSLTKKMTLIK